jgi:hypothetical protein
VSTISLAKSFAWAFFLKVIPLFVFIHYGEERGRLDSIGTWYTVYSAIVFALLFGAVIVGVTALTRKLLVSALRAVKGRACERSPFFKLGTPEVVVALRESIALLFLRSAPGVHAADSARCTHHCNLSLGSAFNFRTPNLSKSDSPPRATLAFLCILPTFGQTNFTPSRARSCPVSGADVGHGHPER